MGRFYSYSYSGHICVGEKFEKLLFYKIFKNFDYCQIFDKIHGFKRNTAA